MEKIRDLWWPDDSHRADVDALVKEHRSGVEKNLAPIVALYYPTLMNKRKGEYRKMIELTTKITMVGRACTDISGYPFDDRRLKIGSLFGACCFLADSFIDDFGEKASQEYIERFELLLTKGWFEIRNKREELFYVIVSRLFAERDVLDTMLRQAIFWQFMAQKRDVSLRLGSLRYSALTHSERLNLLKECGRDKGGCVTSVMSFLLVPEFPLRYQHLLYTAGMLFQYIDDYGDYHYDRYYNRMTYMNQLKMPSQTLHRLLYKHVPGLYNELPDCPGKYILLTFLLRYFVTRLQKHRLEQNRGAYSWTIYE